jgi:hypothetical protein
MSDPVQVALISGGLSLVGIFLSRLWGRLEHKRTTEAIMKIHVEINSRMDELMQAARLAARIEGRDEGRRLGMAEDRARITESERVQDRDDKRSHEQP